MFSRYLTSATVGFAVTCSLLLVMHFLIEISEAVETGSGPRHTLKFVDPIEDTPIRTQEPTPVKINDPVVPPSTRPPATTPGGKTGFRVRTALAPTPGTEYKIPESGVSNNALFNIIAVQPVYPAVAARNGLEGTVIVQFDVSTSGAVENVIVVETSSRIFNKPAIDAAYKFRYKARVVNGTPVATHSIRKLFRFEMEKVD